MPDRPSCVYCRERPAEAPWRPFCSERCKMADLGNWLAGAYRVAESEPAETSAAADRRDTDDEASGGNDA